jgi:hypothetical protein
LDCFFEANIWVIQFPVAPIRSSCSTEATRQGGCKDSHHCGRHDL